ncbi:unnamed protein product (macronuclear) [Paramecium tetraurelia]|uniref:Uncharacterized protein n=1 Tax=Paramecium tetraurelia TaxID=5888 RepID=A0DYR0_PARTE|nr:uncharacterized protein GSPATT00003145001 [Paramecium tetraurelia]CAK88177.1 unnamed protein product [Paramecium tetraurelia]|eukprot:XP_001455574.1 hypothetical protein (macronuclear) [Paramecium tetraurelia strain d4-2]
MIVETKKKKLCCESCLQQDVKFLPPSEIQKNNKLQNDKAVKELYQNGVKHYKLGYFNLDPISIQYDGKYERLRLDHFEVVQKLLFHLKLKEKFQSNIKNVLFKIEQNIRDNHNSLNQLLQQEVPFRDQLEKVQKYNQAVIALCVSQESDTYFDDENQQCQINYQIAINEQERTISRLKTQVQHQNVLIHKIQQSINEPMLGVAGLLNQVGQFKQRIEELNTEIENKNNELVQEQFQLQTVHSILDKIKNLLQKYPSLFREITANNIINIKEFQYDLEQLYLLYSQGKQYEKNMAALQNQYDSLFKELQDEKINQSKMVKQESYNKDPKLKKIIEDLSRLILSKDPNGMSNELRDLIKDLYLKNHQDVIQDQERQIQLLKNQVNQIGIEYENFRTSVRHSDKPPYFEEDQYTQSLYTQAQALEQVLLKIK